MPRSGLSTDAGVQFPPSTKSACSSGWKLEQLTKFKIEKPDVLAVLDQGLG
jgi:hypothetical protein